MWKRIFLYLSLALLGAGFGGLAQMALFHTSGHEALVFGSIAIFLLGIFTMNAIISSDLERKLEIEADNRLKKAELDQAHKMQVSMLPEEPPELDGYEVAVRMKTATEVGGDYYDFFQKDDGVNYIVIGDATGHGLPAGMMVSMTKAGLEAINAGQPAAMMEKLNQVFCAVRIRKIKMALNILRIGEDSVTYCSVGLPPCFLYRSETGMTEEILIPGLPLGSPIAKVFKSKSIRPVRGDVLVFYTDGFPEIRNKNGEILGFENIKKFIEKNGALSAGELLEKMMEFALGHADDQPLEDDITLLILKKR